MEKKTTMYKCSDMSRRAVTSFLSNTLLVVVEPDSVVEMYKRERERELRRSD